jgi:2-oxoglutarate ferredoxin oxidoreductase subunit alpha
MPTTHETGPSPSDTVPAADAAALRRARSASSRSSVTRAKGAQKAGQTFGAVCAKMGNGVWTVEIIPAEIKPPARSRAGASGHPGARRLGDDHQHRRRGRPRGRASTSRCCTGGSSNSRLPKGTIVLLENKWANDPREEVRRDMYASAGGRVRAHRASTCARCRCKKRAWKYIARRTGRQEHVRARPALLHLPAARWSGRSRRWRGVFAKKGDKVIQREPGPDPRRRDFGAQVLSTRYEVPPRQTEQRLMVLNGNQAIGLGVMAAGIEMVAMYPITPATSVSTTWPARSRTVGGVHAPGRGRDRGDRASRSAPPTPARPRARSPPGRAWR